MAKVKGAVAHLFSSNKICALSGHLPLTSCDCHDKLPRPRLSPPPLLSPSSPACMSGYSARLGVGLYEKYHHQHSLETKIAFFFTLCSFFKKPYEYETGGKWAGFAKNRRKSNKSNIPSSWKCPFWIVWDSLCGALQRHLVAENRSSQNRRDDKWGAAITNAGDDRFGSRWVCVVISFCDIIVLAQTSWVDK